MTELLEGSRGGEGVNSGEGGTDPRDGSVATDPEQSAARGAARKVLAWLQGGTLDEIELRNAIATEDDSERTRQQQLQQQQ